MIHGNPESIICKCRARWRWKSWKKPPESWGAGCPLPARRGVRASGACAGMRNICDLRYDVKVPDLPYSTAGAATMRMPGHSSLASHGDPAVERLLGFPGLKLLLACVQRLYHQHACRGAHELPSALKTLQPHVLRLRLRAGTAASAACAGACCLHAPDELHRDGADWRDIAPAYGIQRQPRFQGVPTPHSTIARLSSIQFGSRVEARLARAHVTM